jgi:hypothetical protein
MKKGLSLLVVASFALTISAANADNKVVDGAKKAGEAAESGVKKVGGGIKKGASAVGHGVKKGAGTLGSGCKKAGDAVVSHLPGHKKDDAAAAKTSK